MDQISPEQQAAAKAMIQAVYEDGYAEINGRRYEFLKMTHKQRRKVFAFYSRIAEQVQRKNFAFLDSPDFEPVEAVINAAVTVDGRSLVKSSDEHWDAHPEDYLLFLATALPAISFPFLSAAPTG